MPWWMNEVVVEGAVAAIFGLVIGSFVTALVYRLPRGLPFIVNADYSPVRSMCPPCGRHLTPRELVPVFSWVYQRGRCSCGKTSVSYIYPVIEVVCAVYIVVLDIVHPFGWTTWVFFAMSPFALAAFFMAISGKTPLGIYAGVPGGLWRSIAFTLPFLLFI